MGRAHDHGPETARLRHRRLTADDAEAVFAFNGDPVVMALTAEPPWTSLAQTRERLAAYPDFERHGFGRWGCVHKADGRVIGFSGFKHLPELDEVDLGFRLLPAYWGRGLATESARACLRFGFETLGFDRVIALVLPQNGASRRVLEKIGMRDEGPVDLEDVRARRYAVERGG